MAILHIGMFAADMQAAAGRAIFGDAGGLKQHLVDAGISPLRHSIDGMSVYGIGNGSACQR